MRLALKEDREARGIEDLIRLFMTVQSPGMIMSPVRVG